MKEMYLPMCLEVVVTFPPRATTSVVTDPDQPRGRTLWACYSQTGNTGLIDPLAPCSEH